MSNRSRPVEPTDDVVLWTDNGTSIHLKAVTAFGDPVEMNAEEAREVARVLMELASAVD